MKKLLYLLILPLLVIGCGTSNASSSNNKASSSVKDSSPKPSDTPSVSQTTSIEKEDGYIYDEQDLINIKNDLSATYYLANDITLTKEWVTIGDKENPFTGTIDGRGFTINNLKITNSLSMTEETSSLGRDFISTGGLVGYLTGSINNLNLKNYSIELENQLPTVTNFNANTTEYKVFIGGIAGINNGSINDCNVIDGFIDVSSKSMIGRGRLGGLVGKNEGTIFGCSTSGNIHGDFTHANIRAGGLVGASEGGKTYSSSSSTNIEVSNLNDKAIAGGLIGMVEFSEIDNCYATGNVTTKSNRASTAGGLIGLIDALVAGTTTVTNSYATGTIEATATEKSSYAGGVVGNCEVLISGTSGLVGKVTLENCIYAGAKITSRATYKAHGGAIISCIEGNSSTHTITIKNCNYLKTVNIVVNGTADSKKNSQGTGYSSINELVSTIAWNITFWELTENSLPLLK